jgi:hypothetical protein
MGVPVSAAVAAFVLGEVEVEVAQQAGGHGAITGWRHSAEAPAM